MVAISIQIEGQDGLNWPRWKRLVSAIEEAGFAGLFRSDHFTNARPPNKDALETIVSLTYLADHTERMHFGTLVAPLSFRDPVMLARQAIALDNLSGGRMYLGLGAGWQEREHHLFGYDLGEVQLRMRRFEEGLEVITRLLSSDEPVSYEGQFFRLHGAILLPRPERPGGPPILIGGNGVKRTLPLAARFAETWNAVFLSPGEFLERSQQLDELLRLHGRDPSAVRRTVMLTLFFGRNMDELDRRLSWRHDTPELAGKPLDEVVNILHTRRNMLVGTPETILAQIQEYSRVGADELVLQWFDMDDIEGLQAFASTVLSQV
ncbi:MAG TPA: TIGR03560 family F420-dependent LLM class oxidoreductase [Ktedonobacteraceae bacterium]|jgi:F420-dependent oxidoreductase-like protein|nr:TIGR03560 family F420-dependent LLM class oxidoreductase [Ktedonobacteraceae bacterium]